MKIGSIDILKAYLGALELTSSNAFIGTIPVIENIAVEYEGLKFTSTGNSTIAMSKNGSAPTVDLKYSLDDGETWTQWDFSAISLTDGQTVCFKGKNTTFATSSDCNRFVMTGSIAAIGNIMSIIDDGACTTTKIPNKYCFYGMFYDCTSLTTTPELPATTLTDYCYSKMFYNCTSLTTAPSILPATTLKDSCYQYMFDGCTSLTTAPELHATVLAQSCCYYMFYACTSLTTAPALHATTLANHCYNGMFYGCSNLNYIKCLATNISASSCTRIWVKGVAATGTFVKAASMTSWTTGKNGIPSGWTVQNAA